MRVVLEADSKFKLELLLGHQEGYPADVGGSGLRCVTFLSGSVLKDGLPTLLCGLAADMLDTFPSRASSTLTIRSI